jgi:TRAP transporter 4TM/12TM fusion protein
MALSLGEAGGGARENVPLADPAGVKIPLAKHLRVGLGIFWLVFQIYIIFQPQNPLIERPLHVALAIALVLLWTPLNSRRLGPRSELLIDVLLLCATFLSAMYYGLSAERLAGRMEDVDPILAGDVLFGIVVVLLLLEGVRRVVGWSLLGVLLLFLAYGLLGNWLPGWVGFSGFSSDQVIEILTMSTHGIWGVTTDTSVQFVFYFILFGAVFAAIGGGQLLIDLGLRVSGRHSGGAAKAAVISSSLFGTISGSAVANAVGVGVFTIPLMRRAGYSAEKAASIEAIASTGGQLMPPVMGVAAFVMAEILQVEYARIALAGVIPALAFYVALFLAVDLEARKTGVGTLPKSEQAVRPRILPRLYLLTPPVVLVALLVAGYSATYAAVVAGAVGLLVCYLRSETALGLADYIELVQQGTRQAAQVAVPIAAIGIVIAVAIQSNLALKFSSQLIGGSGGTIVGVMGMIVLGCLIMGMGLPTVAAYIIGAVLFVPALVKLGIGELPAHFFVMYYCVLSMVTPPVALASYAAAGLAGASTVGTSLKAFRLSVVSFLVPFAFAFDTHLLGEGSLLWVALACMTLLLGTAAWTTAFVGYLHRRLTMIERLLLALCSFAIICWPTGSTPWAWALGILSIVGLWIWVVKPKIVAQLEPLPSDPTNHKDSGEILSEETPT